MRKYTAIVSVTLVSPEGKILCSNAEAAVITQQTEGDPADIIDRHMAATGTVLAVAAKDKVLDWFGD